jgi:hypothetical protein
MDTNRTESTNDTLPQPAGSEVPRFHELQQLVNAMESDFQKFFIQGNKAAGTRIRQGMQQLKNFAQAVRGEVQAIKNAEKPS